MKLAFSEQHYLKNEISRNAETLFHTVLMKIPNSRIAKQFILEELEAANLASQDPKNSIANELRTFVRNSGFKEKDFHLAMMNSFPEVDGVGGPQQTLLMFLQMLSYQGIDNPTKALIRVEAVNRIIERFKGQI